MAKSTSKKNPREELEKQYWHVLLTKGKRPSSVYAFTEEIGMEEAPAERLSRFWAKFGFCISSFLRTIYQRISSK